MCANVLLRVGGSATANKILFGLDVMHWHNILLCCVDNHHTACIALEWGLKLIVGRILGYCQDGYREQLPGPFEAGSEIRPTVQRLYKEHSRRRVRSGRAPKGGKFVTAAQFNLCAALGQCIEDESQSKKVRLEFNVKEALGLHERGMLCGGLAGDVWNMQLGKHEEYWESLRVSTRVWAIKKRQSAHGWDGTTQSNCMGPCKGFKAFITLKHS